MCIAMPIRSLETNQSMKTLEEIRDQMRRECVNKINTMEGNKLFTKDPEVIEFWDDLIKEQRQRLIIINHK